MAYKDKTQENDDDWMDNTYHITAISAVLTNLEKQLKKTKTRNEKLKLIDLILETQKTLNVLYKAQVEYIEYKKDKPGSLHRLRKEMEKDDLL